MDEEYQLKNKRHYLFKAMGMEGMITNLEFDPSKEILFGVVQISYVAKNFYINLKENVSGLLDNSKLYEQHMDILNYFKGNLKQTMTAGFDKDGNLHVEKTYVFKKNEYWAIKD